MAEAAADAGPGGAAAISLREIRMVFDTRAGEPLVAVERVSMDIDAGQFVSIVGQSGCGKSTILNMLCGLTWPSAGSVRVEGVPMERPRPEAVGYMQQDPVLLPWRTVLENILLPMEVRGLTDRRDEFETGAHDLLRTVGLDRFAKSYPGELSGGMQQRVALVRTLVYRPRILLMDEPFGALDELTRESMNHELLLLWEATRPTVVFVTHSISEAVFLSDRVVVMTPRPGRLSGDFAIDLPRPRTRDVTYSAEFVEFERVVRQALPDDADRDTEPE